MFNADTKLTRLLPVFQLQIVIEDEYEESNYVEISHIMKNSSISLGDLQEEEYIIDDVNEDVKGDWVVPIIHKDIIYKKKLVFQLKKKYAREIME